ncbi:hypothetical protein [Inquilinus sp.]|jgi:hypothetical protein|uniref:hypothetical protein n=1 Tax=Inquilinus sp. TaxID=1932117 RepID=UPI003784D261
MRGVAMAAATVAVLWSGGAWAAAQCAVSQAADAALQREIELLDSLKVNPADFFSGAKSCIDSSLLRTFDVSSIIPDPLGLVKMLTDQMGQDVLNAAKQKVCDVLNDQLGNAVGGMRRVMNKVVTPDQMVQDALDRVTNRAGLDRINLTGLGGYGGAGKGFSASPPPQQFSPPPIQNFQATAPQPPAPVRSPQSPDPSDEEKRLRCSFLGQCS